MAKTSIQRIIEFPTRKYTRSCKTPLAKLEKEQLSPVKKALSSQTTPGKKSRSSRLDEKDISPPKLRRVASRDRSVDSSTQTRTPIDIKLRKLVLKTPTTSVRDSSPATSSRKPRVAKSLFGKKEESDDENIPEKESSKNSDKPREQPTNQVDKAKKTLNSSFLTELKYRDAEHDQVKNFLTNCLSSQEPGSLYVSGPPGTGKTFCVTRVILELKDKFTFSNITVNCMGCRTPTSIFSKILNEGGFSTPKKAKDSVTVVTEKVATPRKGRKAPMTILVLDEIDELVDKDCDVLYTLFDWPRLEGSRVVVVGICNTLDFTTRSLKRFQSLKVKSIESINFQPYSKDQVKGIIASRLPTLSDGSLLVKENALELCARKVASFSGDIRKAFHVIRRSIEVAENEAKSQLALRQTNDDGTNSPRKKNTISSQPSVQVGVQHVMKVLHEVYASKALEMTKGNQSMPTQQQVALCVMLLFTKFSNSKEVTVSKLHDTFMKICSKKSMGFSIESRSEFLSVCQLLESKGFLSLKSGKETSLTKISLSVNEQEIDEVMTDKSILKAILSDASFVK
jgi:cell division control protein 6